MVAIGAGTVPTLKYYCLQPFKLFVSSNLYEQSLVPSKQKFISDIKEGLIKAYAKECQRQIIVWCKALKFSFSEYA